MTCGNCGRPGNSSRAVYCTSCGSRLDIHTQAPRARSGLLSGMLLAVAALALFLWISRHSSYMSFAEKMSASLTDPDAYFIKEPAYTLLMLVAAFLGFGGAVLVVRELIRESRR